MVTGPLRPSVRGFRVRYPREVRGGLRVLAHPVHGPQELDDLVLLDPPVGCLPPLQSLLDEGDLGLDLLDDSGFDLPDD